MNGLPPERSRGAERVGNFWEPEIPWEEWEWEAWLSIRRWRRWSWTVLWRPTRLFRTKTQKRCPFHYRGLECKSRKSRNTWSNRQIWPWNTEWSRAKTKRVLPREHTGHSKHPLPTTQEMTAHMDITRWSILKSDWLYSLQRWRSSIHSAKTRWGADGGLDHEVLIAKFRIKLKKVGKTTRPFRYDLNHCIIMIIQWKWEIDLRA